MENNDLTRKLYTALKVAESQLENVKQKENEPIAVVGMACRFPGADSVEEFWQQLCQGHDAVTKIPADRWDADYFYSENPDEPGKTYCRHGSFLEDIKGFDPAFFNITPAEARQMDPQQRVLLETVWHALECANIRPSSLADSPTSVFLGISDNNYHHLTAGEMGSTINTHFVTGNALSTASGRVSYFLNLAGANMVVNTACSSSLTAMDLGIQELRAGKTNLVITGGVNLILLPFGHISLSGTRALSADGRCKSFDAGADGYGRGEGCGIAVLKRYSDAVKDGDRIYSIIRGSAVNQDGASNGMTAPNGVAQEKLIRKALAVSSVLPAQVSYVEAHGTGTKLGDPIEIEVLQNVYAADRGANGPLYIGSVKTNVGHLESAAGIASFIKTSLALHYGKIPANLHFKEPNPGIAWHENISVPVALTNIDSENAVAGISSFGFSGTNVHMLLQAAARTQEAIAADEPAVLLLSAKDKTALQQLANTYASYLGNTPYAFQDICYTAAACRDHFSFRLAVVANDKAGAASLLGNFLDTGNILQQVATAEQSLLAFAKNYLASEEAPVSGLPFTGLRVTVPLYQFHHTPHWADSDLYNALCYPAGVKDTNKKPEESAGKITGEDYISYLLRIVKEITELPADQLKIEDDLFSIGMDSIMIIQLKEKIFADIKINLEVSLFYDTLNTIEKIEQHLQDCRSAAGNDVGAGHVAENTAGATNRQSEAYVPYRKIETGKEEMADHREEALLKLVEEVNRISGASKEHTQQYRRWLANNRNIAGFKPKWKEMIYQPVAEKAAGAYIWDKEGNRFLDFTMGFGVHLFGYNPPFVNTVLQGVLNDQLVLGAMSPMAGELAEKICKVTGNERAAFYNTGTEAVMVAVRLARAITGKDKIVMFAGSYHGTFDGILARHGETIKGEPLAPGIARSMVEDVIVLEYGNEEQLEIIEKMGSQLAAVLVEPVQSRRPDFFPAAYLEQLAKITSANNVALIFDEVISGFRFAINGIRNFTPVVPDISVYGKVIGGGVPVGIVSGKAKFLDAVDGGYWSYGDESYPAVRNSFVAGTFCHHPMAMAAGMAVLEHLENNKDIYEQLERTTDDMCEELNAWFAVNRIPVKMIHFGSLFRFVLKGNSELLFYKLLVKGIYIWEGRNCYVSTAHTPEHLRQLTEAIKDGCNELVEEGWIALNAKEEVKADASVFRLSYPQQNIWWADRMNPGSADFNLAETFLVEGGFNVSAFEQACRILIGRHEILRTSFYEKDGMPCQQVHEAVSFDLERVELSGVGDIQNESRRLGKKVYDLAAPPFLRVAAGELGNEQYYLSIAIHHIVCDGWAFEILFDELAEIYGALLSGSSAEYKPAALQYRDYIGYEEEIKANEQLRKFWGEQVSGITTVAVAIEANLNATAHEGYLQLSISGQMFATIKEWVSRSNSTVFVMMMAITKMLLFRYTGAKDIAVGSPVPARNKPGWNKLIGHCLNMLVIRNTIQEEERFEMFCKRVQANILNAYERQEYPFELLKNEFWTDRNSGDLPFFDIEVSMQNFRLRRANSQRNMEDMRIKAISELSVDGRKYPMEFRFDEGTEDILLKVVYDPSKYSLALVNKMLTEWSDLLKIAMESPQDSIGSIIGSMEALRAQEERKSLESLRKKQSIKITFIFKIKKRYMAHERPQFSLKNIKPKSFDPTSGLVKKEPMAPGSFPLVYQPIVEGIILKNWVGEHLQEIEEELVKHGAILFRGFEVADRESFQDVMKEFGHEFLSYKDRSSPRSEIKENIYNSTEHPADQVINMHNELSYSHTWPLKIAFYCFKEAAEGGETPIADVRKVLGRFDEAARETFKEKGILYRRLLQKGIGLPWQEVYQTTDRSVVEKYCDAHHLQYTWMDNDRLEIKWERPAVRVHPKTGEEVWFNHGYFFNFLALAPEIRSAFNSADELPFNTYFGDGSQIPEPYLDVIRDAYREESVYFTWKHGDILLMDNMLAAHGRNWYKGDREINVVMMQACN